METVVDRIDSLDETLLDIERRNRGDSMLANATVGIGNYLAADVCSIYLVEKDELVLRATVGLLQTSIGQVRMSTSEGLVGLVAERVTPVAVASADKHPRFKYFPQAGEEIYESFLGAPMISGGHLLGVIVVQTVEAREFTIEEQITLSHAAERIGRLWGAARSRFLGPQRLEISRSSTGDRENSPHKSSSPRLSVALSDDELSILRSKHAAGATRTSLAIEVLETNIAKLGRSLRNMPLDEAKSALVLAYQQVDAAVSR